MAAAMNGLDALVFTGAIGEHQPQVRAEAAAGLGFLGVAIDSERNNGVTADAEISAASASVRTPSSSDHGKTSRSPARYAPR